MSLNPALYFRNVRIQKIDYLLRPERQAMRGCFYSFAKLFVALLCISLPFHILLPPLMTLNPYFEDNPQPILAYGALGTMGLFGILCAIIAINTLDTLWRKDEKAEKDAQETDLRAVLETYMESKAISQYNKEVTERILRIEGNLNEKLSAMTNKQLALVEDAILYLMEITGTSNAHAYGLKIMFVALAAMFVLTFVPAYEFAESILYSINPRYRGSPVVLFVFFIVAFIVMAITMNDPARYWNRLGPHGRNITRNLVFYWPITFPVLLGVIMWIKDTPVPPQ